MCTSPQKWLSRKITEIADQYTSLYCMVKKIAGQYQSLNSPLGILKAS